jgi:hypothetical protein
VIASDVLSLRGAERGELVLETGRTYDGVIPVRVRVVKREKKYSFDDQGGAVAAAGLGPPRGFPGRLSVGAEREVNVSSRGVVSLPGFEGSSDEWLLELPELVAEGSVALYEALLELDA